MNKQLLRTKLLKWAVSINKQRGYLNPEVNPYIPKESDYLVPTTVLHSPNNHKKRYNVPKVDLCPHMDDANKKAVEVLEKEGGKAFLKHVFTNPDGTQRSYAEMRGLYG